MKIVIISDTHGGHEALGNLRGDVLIHCGDIEHLFKPDDQAIEKMDDWFGRQQFDHILCTGGNHDLTLEGLVRSGKQPFRNATFLHDAEMVIDGIKFYGAPWVPQLENHAFFADERALDEAWSRIPEDVDVLITHTPPAGVLDMSSRGAMLGCARLARRLKAVKPVLHCFGHVHASAGSRVRGATTYVNASSVNSSFEIAVAPFEFDLSDKGLLSHGGGWARLRSWWPFRPVSRR
jgi:Icc-related predicted phosphoesterase